MANFNFSRYSDLLLQSYGHFLEFSQTPILKIDFFLIVSLVKITYALSIYLA